MPNNITNRITSSDPAVLAEIASLFDGGKEGQAVDFDCLVPMPADVKATCDEGLTLKRQQETLGRNWYDWSIEHWGTKWNAYNIAVEVGSLHFDTAWSCPEPIVAALAKKIPGPWVWEYADEDIGRNCGRLVCRDGVIAAETPVYPHAFACAINGCDPMECEEQS